MIMPSQIDVSINNNELNNFLNDFEQTSTIEILEGAEKNEIVEIAKTKGILLKDSIDLAGMKNVYIFPDDANANKERIPKEELLRKLPTLIGKPINLEHIRRNVVGYYIDYRYVENENKVITYGIIFKSCFKNEWEEAQKLFKKGKLTTSYEIWRDTKKDEKLDDGTWLYHGLEVAGGALLLKEKPAFEECRVISIYSGREELYQETKKELKKRGIDV